MGITFIPAAIGLFAIGEFIEMIESQLGGGEQRMKTQPRVKLGFPPILEIWWMKWMYLRSALSGIETDQRNAAGDVGVVLFLPVYPGQAFENYKEVKIWNQRARL